MKKALLFLVFLTTQFSLFGQEICDNALDDDGDGFIDLNDTDCDCEDFEGEIESLIPNPSFNDYTCCPTGMGNLACAVDWIQASGATTDYYNLCGLTAVSGGIAPEMPLPGGDGYAGFYINSIGYIEFVGTSELESPLLAGNLYALNIYVAWGQGVTAMELSLFGSPNDADVPWVGYTCPMGIGDWELLGSQEVFYTDDGAWQEITILFSPSVDINAIAIGPPCYIDPPEYGLNYYYVDEITLIDFITFSGFEQSGGWCSDDLLLTAPTDTLGGSWQWYKDGIALIGETSETFEPIPYGEGEFSAVYLLDGYCKKVDYSSPEIIDVDFEVVSGCFMSTAAFTNTSDGEELDDAVWIWSFGDGDFSYELDPAHLYSSSGMYEVILIGVSTDPSCNDTSVQSVYVAPFPEAAIDFPGTCMTYWAGHDVGTVDNPINFTDASIVDAPSVLTEWLWDFGDGSTSTEENPIYTYSSPGVYDIFLIVTSESGCTDTLYTTELYISELLPNFTLENDCLLEEFTFENTSTLVAPSVFDSWEWNYGDGTTGDTEDGVHTYTESGTYTVSLIAISETGCRDTMEKILEVYPLPSADFEFIVDGISSEAGGTGGCYTSAVTFNDLSLIDLPSEIVSWAWNFGDGATSALENPTHLYGEEGTYTVNLTVTSNFGCESSIAFDVIMTNGLAYLSPDTIICQNGTATVAASSLDGSVYTYSWSIPGSDGSADQVIEGLTDDYWVYVSAMNAAGCISPTDSILITVLDPITLEITANDTACIGDPSGATVTVSGGRGDHNYDWTANGLAMGDNTPVINTNPTLTTVYCVTVSDGCETDPVSICTQTYVPPVPAFTSYTTEGCEPTEISFTDITAGDPDLNESTWYINGETLLGNTVTYLFEEAGSYTIKLTVLSPDGCFTSNSINGYITIHPLPEPELYVTPNPTTYFNTLVTAVNISPNNTSSFAWSMPGASPDHAESDSIVVMVYPELVSGNYTITLIETTQFGCVDSTQTKLIITNDQIIYAPNTFTPDGNNYNQTWGIYIEGIDIYDFHLTLFNRWGEMVWESYNPTGRWDGTYGGQAAQDGVYVWRVQAKDRENDKVYQFEGTVNILR